MITDFGSSMNQLDGFSGKTLPAGRVVTFINRVKMHDVKPPVIPAVVFHQCNCVDGRQYRNAFNQVFRGSDGVFTFRFGRHSSGSFGRMYSQ
ncbi:hypothetical protein ATO7_02820 [Oceanococcus atlanticus]|uniref:Uncharacterized protein n=1 Tax=Oceanococcus atlanticus TaxID=1317117 RepID=A0A1Y1SGI9_9GAMM|nr:hypothetical protein ATO7_02820 [Oceanococcus atlanticus]